MNQCPYYLLLYCCARGTCISRRLQVWLVGEPGATLHLAPFTKAILLMLSNGAPPMHIVNLRIQGRIHVRGSELHLTACQIEGVAGTGGQLGAVDGVRALSVDGGHVILVQTELRGHSIGAIHAHTATLMLIGCAVRDSHARTGAALLVSGSASALGVASMFTNNSAMESGGAFQVRRTGSFAPIDRAIINSCNRDLATNVLV